jgi:hypothetical protein
MWICMVEFISYLYAIEEKKYRQMVGWAMPPIFLIFYT